MKIQNQNINFQKYPLKVLEQALIYFFKKLSLENYKNNKNFLQ